MEIRDENSIGRSMFLIEEGMDLKSALCQSSPEVRKERYMDSGKGLILKHLHLHARARSSGQVEDGCGNQNTCTSPEKQI